VSAPRGPGPAGRIARLLATALVFVVLGPPLGAAIWIGILAALSLPPQMDAADPSFTWFTLLGLIYAVPMSYFFGAGPATVAGLVIGLAQSFVGRAGWPLGLGTGFLVGVVVLEHSGEGTLAPAPDQSAFPEFSAILILACLISTLLCWSLVRSWNFTPAAPGEITS
jgi:hypothetical protein